MRRSIRKNIILKYKRSDSGLSSLGTKSPFVCQFSINFLKYFLDDCFIPGKSDKTLGVYVQSFIWAVKYSSGLRRFEFYVKGMLLFSSTVFSRTREGKQHNRINLKLPGGKSYFKPLIGL